MSQHLSSQEELAQIVQLQQDVATSSLDLTELMQIVCQRTQAITKASGAVIEMLDGEDMVYRAAVGTMGPHLGLRIKAASSLSGLCTRNGEILVCEDAETDPRVNVDACRKVGARSMVVVPLSHMGKPVGVLKVTSTHVNAFTDREVKVLKLIAGLLSARIESATEFAAKNLLLKTLSENETKLQFLVNSAFEGVIFSEDGWVTDANPAFCKMFGYELQEIIDTPILRFIAFSSLEEARTRIVETSKEPHQLTARRKDGSEFIMEASATNVVIAGRRTRIATVRDVTIKMRAEDALRASENHARAMAQTKSEFIANISHEIRTPINGVMGMAALLLESNVDAEQRHYVEIIQTSADSLLHLVNDVLDFSKIEAGKMRIEAIDFGLDAVLGDMDRLFSITAKQRGLKFGTKIETKIPLQLKGDPTRIRQVLLNLIGNAMKFTSKGAVTAQALLVNADSEKVQLRFEVTDTGIGISPEALARMFQAFSQADASTTRQFGGTGLGLSISKHLVEMMGGEIGAQSREGAGSTFWFQLTFPISQPKAQAEPIRKISVPGVKAAVPKNTLRVLIAEDNAVNQLIAQKNIEKMGYHATVVGNGFEAIQCLRAGQYDLVLMDCQMPELDGYEATRMIREDLAYTHFNIPIIAVTASAMAGDRENCLACGMNDYVAKPVKYEELLKAITRVLGHHRGSAKKDVA